MTARHYVAIGLGVGIPMGLSTVVIEPFSFTWYGLFFVWSFVVSFAVQAWATMQRERTSPASDHPS